MTFHVVLKIEGALDSSIEETEWTESSFDRSYFLPFTGTVCLQSMALTSAVRCDRKKGIDRRYAAVFMLGRKEVTI